ncbi:MSHA biogenesis protein MshK [Shewanella sp. D64]|uniref:MSHA biogenesis protein MshK n=1 Tax=unclassified Shewanella TaxID=196818 RepID=UPI0022BA15AD|nr:MULTISPECIES: MSHA biogenesis protein MshK [unclassified Shewanella]MEC4725439.1 MSHA biogenesis protein MshK [Shewanella sp. D64]MEC4738744.1 MSHA biogenesis protein MshK [Shewanella sp. E94]WBJ95036.1 MSHA biogenesis protein MshK [Shewanella sp. MTB7]
MFQVKVNWILAMLVLVLMASVQAETLRDPTRPGKEVGSASTATPEKGHALQLNSIISAGTNSHVVINNQIYVVGDRVQGVKITQIGINSVSLADGRKLNMYQIITETKGSH